MLKNLKGIGLLLLANLLISITLYIVFLVLANVVLPAFGIDIRGSVNEAILLYAAVIGFGGAFISLAFSESDFCTETNGFIRWESPQPPWARS